jgi:hypothetical protein
MSAFSATVRVLLLLVAAGNVHGRGDALLTNSAELNRCLTAVRVALTRRGVVEVSSKAVTAIERTRVTRESLA